MDDIDRYYQTLDLEPGASIEELKGAYRNLVKVWHPDRFSHDPRLQKYAQEKLKDINRAYEKEPTKICRHFYRVIDIELLERRLSGANPVSITNQAKPVPAVRKQAPGGLMRLMSLKQAKITPMRRPPEFRRRSLHGCDMNMT